MQIDWRLVVIPVVFWAIGIPAARKRGLGATILWTGTILAMIGIDLLFQHGLPVAVHLPTILSFFLCVAILASIGWGFHKRGRTKAFIPLAAGVTAILVGMFFQSSFGYAVSHPLCAVGFLLLLIAIPLGFRNP
jgi:hypothetical protein